MRRCKKNGARNSSLVGSAQTFKKTYDARKTTTTLDVQIQDVEWSE